MKREPKSRRLCYCWSLCGRCWCRSSWSLSRCLLRTLLGVPNEELIHILETRALEETCDGIAGACTFGDPVCDAILLELDLWLLSCRKVVTNILETTLLRLASLLRNDDTVRRGVFTTGPLETNNEHKRKNGKCRESVVEVFALIKAKNGG